MSMNQQSSGLPTAAPLPVPIDEVFRLSVDQYHEMIDAGILTEDDPVELLEGFLVMIVPKSPPHSSTTTLTRKALERIVPSGWHVAVHEPITTDFSEPEPDITVVRGDEDRYQDHHPGPQDVALLVEIADSTLQRDQEWKRRLYAQAQVPVYWIINLIDRQVEVYSQPSDSAETPDYRHHQHFGMTDQVPLVIEGRQVGQIAVRDLLA